MQPLIDRAADILSHARRLVILTGAGMSRESGIPTFRDAQEGMWSRYDPQQLATVQGFRSNPRLVWEWYQFRRDLATQALPHAGHRALAALEQRLPGVVVITQNIDGLHARAGSSDVLELHGSIHRFKCLRGHGGYSLADLAGQEETPPRCPRAGCDALIRPDVVWFGEPLNSAILQRAFLESEACDAMLIVGTSGVVQPAASLPVHAWNRGTLIVEVNPIPSELSQLARVFLQGRAGEVLPELLAAMENLPGAGRAAPDEPHADRTGAAGGLAPVNSDPNRQRNEESGETCA